MFEIHCLLSQIQMCYRSSDSKTNLPNTLTLYSTPPTLLKILASSLTNILLLLTKLQLSPKPVTITFVNFAVSGLTFRLYSSTACAIATSIVYSKLDYCNSLYYKLTRSQLSRL